VRQRGPRLGQVFARDPILTSLDKEEFPTVVLSRWIYHLPEQRPSWLAKTEPTRHLDEKILMGADRAEAPGYEDTAKAPQGQTKTKLKLLLRTHQRCQTAFQPEKVFAFVELLKVFGVAAGEIFFQHLFHRLSESDVLNDC
jgi:hypothetical protein